MTSAAILTWFALAPALVGSVSLTGGGAVGDGGLTTGGSAAFAAVLATGAGVTVLMAGRAISQAAGPASHL